MTGQDIDALLALYPDVLTPAHLAKIYNRSLSTTYAQIRRGDFDEARVKLPPTPERFLKSAIRRMFLGIEVGAARPHLASHRRRTA